MNLFIQPIQHVVGLLGYSWKHVWPMVKPQLNHVCACMAHHSYDLLLKQKPLHITRLTFCSSSLHTVQSRCIYSLGYFACTCWRSQHIINQSNWPVTLLNQLLQQNKGTVGIGRQGSQMINDRYQRQNKNVIGTSPSAMPSIPTVYNSWAPDDALSLSNKTSGQTSEQIVRTSPLNNSHRRKHVGDNSWRDRNVFALVTFPVQETQSSYTRREKCEHCNSSLYCTLTQLKAAKCNEM